MATQKPERNNQPLLLTVRQQQLLGLLAEGCSNKEIARKFCVTEGTVKQHLVILYRKLAVSNRNRAALIGQRLVREGALQRISTSSMQGSASPYQWRFINAIALTLPMPEVSNAAKMRDRDLALDLLHDRFGKLVEALEGVSMTTPCGGILAWFGHPRAHADDADRVVQLAYLAHTLRRNAQNLQSGLSQLGIGVAGQNEMVRETSDTLYGAQVFPLAIALAERSRKIAMALCTGLTAQLGHLPVRWTKLPSNLLSRQTVDTSGLDAPYVGLVDAGAGADLLAKPWGGMPFFSGLCKSVCSGKPEWVGANTEQLFGLGYLFAALSAIASSTGMWVLDLRMPRLDVRDSILRSLFLQLEDAAELPSDHSPGVESTAGERLSRLIGMMANRRPLCLIVHGQNSLDMFRQLLTEQGIQSLQNSPLIVIGHLEEDLRGRAVIKTLGPRGIGLPFNRSYELVVPQLANQKQGFVIGIRALLDRLSPLAREILVESAHQPADNASEIILDSGSPIHEVQNALSELQLMGLIVPHGAKSYVFKDERVPGIICSLDAG